jgi:hypothetical protein
MTNTVCGRVQVGEFSYTDEGQTLPPRERGQDSLLLLNRDDRAALRLDMRERAEAVEFRFENEVGMVERFRDA